MMFIADAAFALELLALVAGVFLLLAGCKEGTPCRPFVKFVAYFVILASIFTMLCTSYFTLSYWMHGGFYPMGTGHMRNFTNPHMWQPRQNMPNEMMPGPKDGDHMMDDSQ